MGQDNVYNLLKRKDKWLTAKEISVYIKINQGNVIVSLKKLLKQGAIIKKSSRLSKGFFGISGSRPYYWRVK